MQESTMPASLSRRDAVLYLLEDYAWHDTAEINRIGGTEGTRRLRELRERGYRIEKRQKPAAQDGTPSTQFQYRLMA